MSEKIAPRERDFSQWYQDVVLQAQLADYSPVKGCMVIRPNGYSIWERLQRNLNDRIAAQGVRNAYFPVFIPESFIKKEAQHVEGFAPQLAVVTHAGGKQLEEPLVVRPTSETVINSMFAKWVQSYRDLPLLINQWANVVRWEMRTRLFLRTTEFLWQEGHTCHATAEEAEMYTRRMLGVYRDFAHEVLCMPVFWGRKTDSERFAGALRTYCIEAMMQDKKALQAGTSHNLSTHFAKAFETKFLDTDNQQKLVHQTSWGVSTRLIGGIVMTHSDDKGLVLPPMLAETHVRIIPMFGKAGDAGVKPKVVAAVDALMQAIRSESQGQLPYTVGVNADMDEGKQAGWKFHEAELVGIPLRIDVGPRDLEKGEAVLVRRDRPEKQSVPLKEIPARVVKELKAMQKDLLESAIKFRDANTYVAKTYADLKDGVASGRGFAIAPYCNSGTCEAKIKEETKATVRCLTLNDAYETKPGAGPCLVCGKSPTVEAVIALSY